MIHSRLRIPRRGLPRALQKRRQFFERAGSLAPMVAVDAGRRGRFLVRTDDLHIGRSLFVAGTRQEMDTLDLAVEVLQVHLGKDALARSALIDVGANIGTTTVPALRCGPFGRALAIEPETDNFSNLRLNVQLNELESKVAAVQAAAWSFEGSAHLLLSPARSGKHRLARADEKQGDQVEVATTTVDAAMQREGIKPEEVGLLWVDAEGSEDRVLAGAAAVLELGRPIVLELNPLLLERTGGSQIELEQSLERHYSHFTPLDQSSPATSLRPMRELPPLVRGLDKGKKLDVLLLQGAGSPIAASRAAAVRRPA